MKLCKWFALSCAFTGALSFPPAFAEHSACSVRFVENGDRSLVSWASLYGFTLPGELLYPATYLFDMPFSRSTALWISVASFGIDLANIPRAYKANYLNLVGHALDEAADETPGPYTQTLAEGLNYFLSGGYSISSRSQTTNARYIFHIPGRMRIALTTSLGNSRINAPRLHAAMKVLYRQNSLCGPDGRPVSARVWATQLLGALHESVPATNGSY